ncbi:alanine--tRNA ligase [Actinomadura algeriensis]|uniref:Alanine--tRNA ligase n=1 Tax=Actinomadura algeriensis TaxID=1679523 RepID=A0ABR9JIC5_9ACTN|nr:alanine--tRNA ligase [Actinomadura algeriensis]MBE1530178.1 alanyl-tRNA synthetase [Actinomadura algeriensis]
MRSPDIRTTFLDFFRERGHRAVPSSPLVPSDPTLLLANAGMNQFKPYFLGETTPDHPRAMSVQKCVRTSDIENVGRTARHTTFFEMLGNFSFGDYFKQEAISWSWELLTEHFNLDPSRLWVTVYLDDDETVRLWRRIGVPSDRIQRLGMKDNYWSMGIPGPCGPSSELHYDRGPQYGPEGGPAVDGERYHELWNLVFMQNLRGDGPGKEGYPILGELPAKNIDTGLGLDRLAAILQDADGVCDTDLVGPALRLVRELAAHDEPVSSRIVAEHSRSIAFLIADGVLPSPDGRGHVLRRLMRRAILHARRLGIDDPVLAPLTTTVVDGLGGTWPELTTHADLIRHVVTSEEEGFEQTLRHGTRFLETAVSRSTGTISGATAFKLQDSYGFPIDLTLDAARSAGLTVDEDAFAELVEERRRQALEAGRSTKKDAIERHDTYRRLRAEHGPTEFVGHDTTETETRVLAIVNGTEVILDRSPFYAEGGGQVGDTGEIRTPTATLRVLDTRAHDGMHVHTVRVMDGELRPAPGHATVDVERRLATARSHTATHVLHAMLRRVLGDHAAQRGSRVEPGRLRFDFAHHSPVDVAPVQTLVNEYLLDDPDVHVWEASRAEAETAGALAPFGEQYGEHVRIVDIGDASRELCGGTHVAHGSQAGPVRVIGESSIGTGLRRVEALTGPDALRHYDHEHHVLSELVKLLETPPDRLHQRVETLLTAQRELRTLHRRQLDDLVTTLASTTEQHPGGRLITRTVDVPDLRTVATKLLPHTDAIILGTRQNAKATLVAALGPAFGTPARDLLARAAREVGGGAGGKGPVAHAGGPRADRLPRAMELATADARALLSRSAG